MTEETDNFPSLSEIEAAQYLNVSRPYVIKLVDDGKLSSRRVGQSRLIPFDEIKKYRMHQEESSYAAMAELQAMAQTEECADERRR